MREILKGTYSRYRDLLPARVRVALSRAVFSISGKPHVDNDGYILLKRAVVILSADFELAWAWRFSKSRREPEIMAFRERRNIPVILEKLDQLGLPVTWATVGHLFLEFCERQGVLAHSSMPRPSHFTNDYWDFTVGDWYSHDPCSSVHDNPAYYAPDLITRIMASDTKHEIACHSFSHCDFSESRSTPELIRAELQACHEAMARFGIHPESFVFPGNFHGHFSILKEFGYCVARFKTNPAKEIGFPEVLPEGMVAIHDTLPFDQAETGWSAPYLRKKFSRYIEKAVQTKSICHFWFHPSIGDDDLYGLMVPVLEQIAAARDQGLLEVLTMNQVPDLIRYQIP